MVEEDGDERESVVSRLAGCFRDGGCGTGWSGGAGRDQTATAPPPGTGCLRCCVLSACFQERYQLAELFIPSTVVLLSAVFRLEAGFPELEDGAPALSGR